jgi:hypothetical protein
MMDYLVNLLDTLIKFIITMGSRSPERRNCSLVIRGMVTPIMSAYNRADKLFMGDLK